MRIEQPWWHTHAKVGKWRGNLKSEHSLMFRSDSLIGHVHMRIATYAPTVSFPSW